MNRSFLLLSALFCSLPAAAQEGRPQPVVIAEANSSMLVKMTSAISTTNSKPGDRISGVIIDPVPLRGARAEGMVERADHAILSFTFNTLRLGERSWPIQSRLVSITSSKGNEGRDDLDNRVRIEGMGIIAFGTATALDEGAEVRMTAWKR